LPSPVSGPFRKSLDPILGNKQVTDAYLLALAGRNNATLLTFDARLVALAGASGRAEVLTG
jgi:predicted nucleic acid-binding protein